MARKAPLITDQIAALEEENERLINLKKLFDKAIKSEFGIDSKSIHKLIKNGTQMKNNNSSETSDFEQQICSYFDLYLMSDKDAFLKIMCTQKSLNYYQKQLKNDQYSDDVKDSFSDGINDDFSDDNDNLSDDYSYNYSGGNE